MLRTLRNRWYYPRCFRLSLPDSHSLFLWAFSPLWPDSWPGRRVWQHRPDDRLCSILTIGPLEFSLSFPHWSRVARLLDRAAG